MTPNESSLLIQNAHLFDPTSGVDYIGSIFIRDGKIAELGEDLSAVLSDDIETLDARGHHLFPAFCDLHVHFRTPGQTEKEDIESGSRAALAGGFTTVIQMPNTNPVIDQPDLVADLTRDEPIELRVLGAVTIGSQSRELVDFASLHQSGAVGFTDDGQPVIEKIFMRAALDYSSSTGLPIASHAEDPSIGLRGIIRSGLLADSLGVPGWNPRRESSMIERDVELVRQTGGHVHICHVSTKQSVDTIRQAKADGVNITAEVTPHHFSLTIDDIPDLGTNGKMNPPLGTKKDRIALIEGIKDGTIDCIATDHAPHTLEDKAKELEKAPYGVIGLESSFAVSYTELVQPGRIDLGRLIEAMSSRPREIFNLEKIGLFEGSRADLVLVDLDEFWAIDPDLFESKAGNCPFAGKQVSGKVLKTIYKGTVAWSGTA
jgi:dihydroorotase